MKGLSFILLSAVGALVITGAYAVSKAKQLASQVKIKFLQFGTPEIKSNSLQLPIALEVTNPSAVTVPVQNISINFYTKFQNEFVKIGESPTLGAISFVPGANQVVTYPVIYFDKVKELFSQLNSKNWLNYFSSDDLAEVRIDLILTVGFIPVTIPVFTRFNVTSLITSVV